MDVYTDQELHHLHMTNDAFGRLRVKLYVKTAADLELHYLYHDVIQILNILCNHHDIRLITFLNTKMFARREHGKLNKAVICFQSYMTFNGTCI